MNATESKFPAGRGWIVGLALASLVLPVATVTIVDQRAAPFADPANLGNYRLTVAALILGIACAIGAFVFNRALTPAWFRWLSVGLAGLGVLLGAYLLLGLIGTCGLAVLWGSCNP